MGADHGTPRWRDSLKIVVTAENEAANQSIRLLRTHGEPLAEVRPGFTKRFSIYDANDQVAAIKSVYRAIGLDE